jgi:hypothetical protein
VTEKRGPSALDKMASSTSRNWSLAMRGRCGLEPGRLDGSAMVDACAASPGLSMSCDAASGDAHAASPGAHAHANKGTCTRTNDGAAQRKVRTKPTDPTVPDFPAGVQVRRAACRWRIGCFEGTGCIERGPLPLCPRNSVRASVARPREATHGTDAALRENVSFVYDVRSGTESIVETVLALGPPAMLEDERSSETAGGVTPAGVSSHNQRG